MAFMESCKRNVFQNEINNLICDHVISEMSCEVILFSESFGAFVAHERPLSSMHSHVSLQMTG